MAAGREGSQFDLNQEWLMPLKNGLLKRIDV
jgi:hypothetical protein